MAVSFAPVNNTSKRPLAPVPLEKGGMPWQSVLATKGALAALDQAADRLLPPVLPRGLRGKGGVDDVEELTRTQPLQWSHVLGQFQVVPCSNGQAGSSLQPALPPALFAVEGRREGLEAGRVEGEAGVTRTRSRRAMSRGERGEADRGNGLGSLEGRPKASGVTGATEREDGNEEREADSCNPEGDFPLSLVQSEIPAPTFRRLDSPEAAVEGGEGREREEGREEKEGEEEGEEEEEEDISDEAILARHEETLKQIWERYARWRELRKRQRPPRPPVHSRSSPFFLLRPLLLVRVEECVEAPTEEWEGEEKDGRCSGSSSCGGSCGSCRRYWRWLAPCGRKRRERRSGECWGEGRGRGGREDRGHIFLPGRGCRSGREGGRAGGEEGRGRKTRRGRGDPRPARFPSFLHLLLDLGFHKRRREGVWRGRGGEQRLLFLLLHLLTQRAGGSGKGGEEYGELEAEEDHVEGRGVCGREGAREGG
ncbi:hypothetical protein Naga_100570g1 [Nannochloropsis gaditana]|uniref:Uncharacterized protein n=1 Tax=Nannochloropsis gaditana TaxID=72520 RepID=W7T9J8_9STRA|nr:hypothetical protein Naga_100570g1 [Nannochloropsis gaditana]